jgi:hypothetical protein
VNGVGRAKTIDGAEVDVVATDCGIIGDYYVTRFSVNGYELAESKTPHDELLNLRNGPPFEQRFRNDCAALRKAGIDPTTVSLNTVVGQSVFRDLRLV